MALLDDIAADAVTRFTQVGLSVAGVEVAGNGYARQTPAWGIDAALDAPLAFDGPASAGPVDGVIFSDGVTDLTYPPSAPLAFNSDGRLDLATWSFSVDQG